MEIVQQARRQRDPCRVVPPPPVQGSNVRDGLDRTCRHTARVSWDSMVSGRLIRPFSRLALNLEDHRERRSASDVGTNVHGSACLLTEPLNDRKPKTCSAIRWFRAELLPE